VQKSSVFTSVVIIANFCQVICKRILPDKFYLCPCGQVIISVAAGRN